MTDQTRKLSEAVANTATALGTPANSTATVVSEGTFWFDDNYIYIATSNNYVKRSTLSSF